MSDANKIIGLVSESLKKLLEGKLDIEPEQVTVLAPSGDVDNLRINLFLYKIQENSALKNMDWQAKSSSPNQLTPPPLSLHLFYLMTAYSSSQNPFEAHNLLGRAMHVFYENPILQLQSEEIELHPPREPIRIMLNTMDIDELSRIWSTFSQPYRLSVMYEVSVVQLDATSERTMASRVRQIGVPDVRAPYRQPALQRIEPVNGLAGSSINVYGESLSGWKAYVRAMGSQILETPQLLDDSFEVTIPENLPTGFQEIRVDISNLCRRTFFFEVTPAVDRIEPLRGPAGTKVTFYGRDLGGFFVSVTVSGSTLLDEEPLDPDVDKFQVPIPSDLPQGVHQFKVQISDPTSDLYERIFSFEVTA
jgi:hypothetical protein